MKQLEESDFLGDRRGHRTLLGGREVSTRLQQSYPPPMRIFSYANGLSQSFKFKIITQMFFLHSYENVIQKG